MPNIYLEYSANLADIDLSPLAIFIHQQLVTHCGAKALACKTRLLPISQALVGLQADPQQAFLYIKICLMQGRSDAQKQQLVNNTFHFIQQQIAPAVKALALHCQPRIYIEDMPTTHYHFYPTDWMDEAMS